jgi:activator of 2-hydroxyglutaryl-CoA dehydratase
LLQRPAVARKTVAKARLPIQDELTFALLWSGFSLIPESKDGIEKMQGRARPSRSRCVMNTTEEMSSQEETMIKYVCGIDLGSQSCAGCIMRPDKSVVVKPLTFTNAKEGWQVS